VNLVEVVNATQVAVDEEAVAALVDRVLQAEGVDGAELGVEFVGERRIRDLNREHRGKDQVTDVLSFPLEDFDDPEERGEDEPDAGDEADAGEAGPPRLLGDVVVCARQALRQARADGLPEAFEVAVLLVHGTLHVLGHDHETDAGQMALRQAEVLELVSWEGLLVAPSR
jgi:probable rRNA maturation factor